MFNLDRQSSKNDAIVRAAERGRLDDVNLLIKSGANIHAENEITLRMAAKHGHHEIVQLLTDLGADIHAEDNEAIRFAAEEGHIETVRLLAEKGADIHAYYDDAIKLAAWGGHSNIVTFLCGFDDTPVNSNYTIAMMKAAYRGDLEIVMTLINRGVSTNLVREEYLEKAISLLQADGLRKLLLICPHIEPQNLLKYAAKHNSVECACVLFELGAKPDMTLEMPVEMCDLFLAQIKREKLKLKVNGLCSRSAQEIEL